MRIIKTKAQVEKEEQRRQKKIEKKEEALKDCGKCPECGETSRIDFFDYYFKNSFWPWEEYLIVYQFRCGKCHCEWESEPFQEVTNG